MSKVKELPINNSNSAELFIRDLLKNIEEGTIDVSKLLVISESPNKEVLIGKYNMDLLDMQLMNSHLNIQIMWDVVKANVDELIEWIN